MESRKINDENHKNIFWNPYLRYMFNNLFNDNSVDRHMLNDLLVHWVGLLNKIMTSI